jgi:hypothetical protein
MGYHHPRRPAINGVPWPLPNVWLGVSVENQAAADERIPLLLQCPAAVRWLSCEPLLGPIDLRGWGEASAYAPAEDAPSTWNEYQWPEWVPSHERQLIQDFWSERYGRGPRAWLRDNCVQSTPRTGARVGFKLNQAESWMHVVPALSPEAVGHGRYIHRWNNIGVVVTDDGIVHHGSASVGPGWLARWRVTENDYRHRLHWVVAGGESGPSARPMHPDWARSLRDQCAAAGVPFFFKQWGEFSLSYDRDRDDPDYRRCDAQDRLPGKWINLAGGHGFHGERVHYAHRVGKKAAGRMLDGAEHNAYPEVAHG